MILLALLIILIAGLVEMSFYILIIGVCIAVLLFLCKIAIPIIILFFLFYLISKSKIRIYIKKTIHNIKEHLEDE